MRRPAIIVFAFLALLFFACETIAQDRPAPTQGPGEHSTICLEDGTSIRDDELADYVAAKINENVNNGGNIPQDVKIMVNSCFGGGILDDFQRIFDSNTGTGVCAGIPWVGVAASAANEPAWAPNDSTVDDPVNAPRNLGSDFTSALAGPATSFQDNRPGAIRDGGSGDTVMDDFDQAAARDDSGPNVDGLENPVVASGNGGHAITWDGTADHSAVVFGGHQTNQRHHNNVDNVEEALSGVWAGDDPYIRKVDGGNRADLESAIDGALFLMGSDEQFVLYIDDHGDREFDFDEWFTANYPGFPWVPITSGPGLGFDETVVLDDGWTTAMQAMDAQPGDAAEPTLNVTLEDVLLDPENWEITLNGVPLPLADLINPADGTIPPGDYELPVDWTTLNAGPNNLTVTGLAPGAPPLFLLNLELSSGPVNELQKAYVTSAAIPEPTTWMISLLGLIGVAFYSRQRKKTV